MIYISNFSKYKSPYYPKGGGGGKKIMAIFPFLSCFPKANVIVPLDSFDGATTLVLPPPNIGQSKAVLIVRQNNLLWLEYPSPGMAGCPPLLWSPAICVEECLSLAEISRITNMIT